MSQLTETDVEIDQAIRALFEKMSSAEPGTEVAELAINETLVVGAIALKTGYGKEVVQKSIQALVDHGTLVRTGPMIAFWEQEPLD